ncbi:hypothetical protein BDA99DRAFT_154061, partial [Phascolomyces articulosus]
MDYAEEQNDSSNGMTKEGVIFFSVFFGYHGAMYIIACCIDIFFGPEHTDYDGPLDYFFNVMFSFPYIVLYKSLILLFKILFAILTIIICQKKINEVIDIEKITSPLFKFFYQWCCYCQLNYILFTYYKPFKKMVECNNKQLCISCSTCCCICPMTNNNSITFTENIDTYNDGNKTISDTSSADFASVNLTSSVAKKKCQEKESALRSKTESNETSYYPATKPPSVSITIEETIFVLNNHNKAPLVIQ